MNKASGVSYLELILAILILGVLFSFAVPSIKAIYQKNQLEQMENDIITSVHYARNQAILQQRPLILAPFPENGDWSQGMILTTKDNRIIHQWRWNNHALQIRWCGFLAKDHLLFAAELKQAACNGHFLIESHDGSRLSKLVINRFGRIKKEIN